MHDKGGLAGFERIMLSVFIMFTAIAIFDLKIVLISGESILNNMIASLWLASFIYFYISFSLFYPFFILELLMNKRKKVFNTVRVLTVIGWMFLIATNKEGAFLLNYTELIARI